MPTVPHKSAQPTGQLKAGARHAVLVVEHGRYVEGGWFYDNLKAFLTPGETRLSLVEAVTGRPDGNLLMKEQDRYWELFERWRADTEELSAMIRDNLAGYVIGGELVVSETDDGTEEIIDRLKQNGEPLTVIGTSPQGVGRDRGNSSFSIKLTSHAPNSVLLLRRPLANPERLNVLFATDGGESAENAARKLPELIRGDNLSVTLMNVQNLDPYVNPIVAPYVNTGAVQTAVEKNARAILAMTRDILATGGVQVVDEVVAFGAATWQIMTRIGATSPDLVVVGAHNPRDVLGSLLGNVPSRLIHHDFHNLLVVR